MVEASKLKPTDQEKNLILIGMPSAGKTTIGKLLAQRFNKDFIDLDDIIIEKAKIPIAQIFAEHGENEFRRLETMAALEVSEQTNKIISTGGGTIKKKCNMDHLSRNGVIIYIDRDLNKLNSNDPTRPLSASKEALKKLYEERHELYQRYADIIITNNNDIEDTVDHIVKAYYHFIQNTDS